MVPRPTRGSGSLRERKSEEDDLESMKKELEHEKRLRDTIEWSNAELERSIQELAEEVENLENASPRNDMSSGPGMNEWYVRLEAQVAVNEQLEQQQKWLELELEQAKQQINSGSFPEAMNFDMDSLSESELIRLTKHLERGRTDLYSALRDLEWKLDKEGKEYHRLSETRSMYQAELRHYNRTLERLKSQHIHSGLEQSEFQSPHSGFTRWGTNSGMKNNLRIIDARKGPIRKTVNVKNLPKIISGKEMNEKQNKGLRKRRNNKKSESSEEKGFGESTSERDSKLETREVEEEEYDERNEEDSGVQTEEKKQDDHSKDSEGDSKDDTEDKDTED